MTVLAGIVGLGAAVLVLGMAPPEPLFIAAAALLTVGLMVPFCNGPITRSCRRRSSRPSSGASSRSLDRLAVATAPLGLLLAAPIASAAGVRAWFLASGAISLAMGAVGFVVPALVRIEESSGDLPPARAMSGIALE